MSHRFYTACCRTVLIGIALMSLASLGACNSNSHTSKKTADNAGQIDSGAVGAERVRALPCSVTHRKPCTGTVQPTGPVQPGRVPTAQPARPPVSNTPNLGSWLRPGLEVFVVLLIIWGISKAIRSRRQPPIYRPIIQAMPDLGASMPHQGEDAFNEWVGKNIIASGDLSPEMLNQLRERFEKERQ